jgi:Rieske Fe-S protein
MERREFMGACSGAFLCSAVATPQPVFARSAKPQAYERVQLLDEHGRPLRASALPKRRNLVFSYPYVATPAFLLDLGKPAAPTSGLPDGNGESYAWPGGVGPSRSIVAFAAICAHQLAYPTREISFISYREKAGGANRRGEVIHCCAEHSQYDPAAGAKVLAGPAPHPLTAILLEYDGGSDSLTATGTLGGELYEAFFAKYDFRLAMEYGGRERSLVAGDTRVMPIEQVCRQQVRC